MNEEEFNAILPKLQSRQNIDCNEMQQAIGWILGGEARADTVKRLLELLAEKGESVAELVGAARALRESMRAVESKHEVIIDTCGTGGDGSKTFNISTAAALVTAAAGVAVAKHGNRKVTSSTGSADVLAELGINLEASPEVVAKCLDELGICFCFAPFFHPAMRHVAPIRREISHPTIFNRLGPLANPAMAGYQVLGVGQEDLLEPMAEALQQLGTKRSLVVHGEDGVDELSLSAGTTALEVTPEAIRTHRWQPSDFGLQPAHRDELFADDPVASAACIREILEGTAGPKRDVVVMNAAAALWIAGKHDSLLECRHEIESAIDSGKAKQLVTALASMSNSA